MTDAQVFQGRIFGSTQVAVDPQIAQARVFAMINVPAEFAEASQAFVVTAAKFNADVEVSQARVFALGRGRIDNRRLRDWGFPLDGHDLYVLRLGEDATIVYDLTTGQWADWEGHGLPFWRAHLGQQWIGMGRELLAQGHTTNIVAGDDSTGMLWTLAPELGVDESPRTDRDDVPFDRTVTGGIPMRMRQTVKCNAVYVTMALGEPALTGAAITLRTSDDMGRTWLDHGTLTVTADDWTQEIAWRALGLIRAPGRIFEFTDNGASARISGAEMR